ncbi:MAG: polysaccharide deacetylase family protein [Lentisphaeria bacterium]|nr:polysaccharide deacetylase family protein [Lentisphaeria bacterium]
MADKKFYFIQTVDDTALAGWYSKENFCKLLDFFAEQQVKATFFTVPVDEESGLPFFEVFPELPELLKKALCAGHSIGQHGLKHNRFELGVPPAMVLDLPHETENKRYAATHKAELEADHCVENCRARLNQGRKILEDALGIKIKGFRAPALQASSGMFAALSAENYLYDSSTCYQETGWDYLVGKLDTPPRELDTARWQKLCDKGDFIEFPLPCDYSWQLAEENFELMFNLAKHDVDRCFELGLPFVSLCHVDPVFDGCGIKLLESVYAYARQKAADAGVEILFENMDTVSEILKQN